MDDMEHHKHSANNKNTEHMNMGHDMAGGGKKMAAQGHQDHHAHMVADFRKRFWVSLVITVPVLMLSPLIQGLLGIADIIDFPGDTYILCAILGYILLRRPAISQRTLRRTEVKKPGHDDPHRTGHHRCLCL